jgi:hypothetical protein
MRIKKVNNFLYDVFLSDGWKNHIRVRKIVDKGVTSFIYVSGTKVSNRVMAVISTEISSGTGDKQDLVAKEILKRAIKEKQTCLH